MSRQVPGRCAAVQKARRWDQPRVKCELETCAMDHGHCTGHPTACKGLIRAFEALAIAAVFRIATPAAAGFHSAGWGGRIRTYGTRYQKPLPYHLATPQNSNAATRKPELGESSIATSAACVNFNGLVVRANFNSIAQDGIKLDKYPAHVTGASQALADNDQVGHV